MGVEYAGILAAVSLMAVTLTGAYGKNVTAVFNSSSVGRRGRREGGEGAEGPARRREDRVHACAVREARAEVPLCARLDRWNKNPGQCGLTLLGEGAAKEPAARRDAEEREARRPAQEARHQRRGGRERGHQRRRLGLRLSRGTLRTRRVAGRP